MTSEQTVTYDSEEDKTLLSKEETMVAENPESVT